MDLKEILRSLQAGKINPEAVKQEFINTMKPKAEQIEEKKTEQVVYVTELGAGIVQITMKDEAHKNAFSDELVNELEIAFKAVENDNNNKVIILTGYNGYFSLGGTKDRLLEIHDGTSKYTDTTVYRMALDCKLPVIAAMQGHAFGAGWCMGMFSDFIVMSRESIYSANFMKFGFTPGAGSTLVFPEKLGSNNAREILFTGKRYYGSELEAKGVTIPILPQKDVLPYAIQLAQSLAESSREALVILKEHMTEPVRSKLADIIEKELEMHEKTFLNQSHVKEKIQSTYGQLSKTVESGKVDNLEKNCKPQAVSNKYNDSIAIIGMSGRFPSANNIDEFWNNIKNGKNCISEVPPSRWAVEEYFDADPKTPNKTYSKWMGVLEDEDKFDPLFFNISPAEAELMDPQQRLFLESCWQCIEAAGINPHALFGSRCGVFAGCVAGDYGSLVGSDGLNAQGLMGSSNSMLAARISYLLNLKGPCMSIDTACSASLVAIAEACNSLILYNSDMALAGGVGIMAGPTMHIMSSKAGMLSPDGQCYTFDSRANGFVPGEGVGVILLKRLSDAVRDKDPIYGVIKGWGVNQDGKTNGITAPSTSSQSSLEREVYKRFNINPETITMVEAHGTGTKLGDPIEVEALTEAFRSFTSKNNYCALGSVKSNIGHLFAAAGVAGVIKILLALQNKMLPPTINFEVLNEHISLEDSPFYVNTSLQPWGVKENHTRKAAVSSFGFSGTNAHIVIEEYIPPVKLKPQQSTEKPVLFVLSAKTEERLKAYAGSMRSFIAARENINMPDMAYTLQIGRPAMEHRLAVLAASREQLLSALEGYINGKLNSNVFTGSKSNGSTAAFDGLKEISEINHEETLTKAAKAWVNGGRCDWTSFYDGFSLNRINLPTYPFARERYWKAKTHTGAVLNIAAVENDTVINEQQSEISIEDTLKNMISQILGIAVDKIDSENDLTSYGFDSISGMSLINSIKGKYQVEVPARAIFENNSIRLLKEYLINEKGISEASFIEAPEKISDTNNHEQEIFPLSASQMGLWLIDQLSPESYAYNLPSAFNINRIVNVKALKSAFDKLVHHHPILNASINVIDKEPVNVIKKENNYHFEQIGAEELSEGELKALVLEKAQQPFNLEKGPLMRVYLISITPEKHILLINIHHIVFDGSSLPVLLKDLLALYSAELEGHREIHNAVLPAQSKSYADFVRWQSAMLDSEEGQNHKAYWQKKLEGELPILDLPICKPRTETTELKGKTYMESLSAELTEAIQRLCAEEKASPFVVMLSAFKVLLHKYTNQEDIMVGTAMQGRPGAEYESLIGYFINMALLRTQVSGEAPFRELIRAVQQNTYDALEHGIYPFSEVVKEKSGNKNRGSSPLIQAVFVFQNWLKNTDQLFGNKDNDKNILTLEPIPEIHQEGEFDISLEVIKDENNYSLFLKYNNDLFDDESIAKLCQHYIEVLKSVTQNPAKLVSRVNYISEQEKNTLQLWNNTSTYYPKDKCVQQLFEEQVKQNPDNIAVMFKDQILTYDQLNRKANKLARILRNKGVKPDSIVAIMVERSLEMPIGLFGIIKSGGAYLPIDPAYPTDRIKYILENSKASILLVQGKDKPVIDFKGQIIGIQDEEIISMDDSDLECINKPTDLAYVIYTSGSTGNPKGAMLEHHSLINRLKWMQKAYSLTKEDTILQKTPYTFDVSVWEQFWWALEGARVCFLPPKAEKDPQAIVEAVDRYKITVMHFVPSMLNIFLEYVKGFTEIETLKSLRQVFASGEALTLAQVRLFNELLNQSNATKLMNLYGPTEATIDVSYFDCSTGKDLDRVPIGIPIDNIQLHIIDKYNQLQAVGVPGELCIAGVGLARGYLNNKKLTEEKFIDNPFEKGTKMYKTGDLAKWLPDGNIEYLGRIDRQVKIRGFRIELGEIEAVLSQHDSIKEICVTVDAEKDITGSDKLKAYIVVKENKSVLKDELKGFLKDRLPEYMVPADFVYIDYIPLTAHGKADIKALQAYERSFINSNITQKPLETDIGKISLNKDLKGIVTEVYKEMLQINEIDPKANFFDIGGHSLLLVKAAMRLKELLNRDITTVDMFQYTTIDSLTDFLSKGNTIESNEKGKKNSFAKSKQKAARQRDILMKLRETTS